MLPRAQGVYQGNVFESVDRRLQRPPLDAPRDAKQWGARMRNALSSYRHAEHQLSQSQGEAEQQGARNIHSVGRVDATTHVHLEQLRRQVRGALHIMHNMCDRARHRVPDYVVDELSKDQTWESFQSALTWRRRELVQPLHWSLPEPPARTYSEVFDRLVCHRTLVADSPTVDAWAQELRQTLVPEYRFLEDRCHAVPDKSLKTYAWRLDAMRSLDRCLARPWMPTGAWAPGFESLSRQPLLCDLIQTCRAALALRTQELDPAWAHDIS